MFLLFENRHIGAFGNFDVNREVFTGDLVIPLQNPSQLVGPDAHDGVNTLVAVRSSIEYIGRNGVILRSRALPASVCFTTYFKRAIC